jgi:hypothetical protein
MSHETSVIYVFADQGFTGRLVDRAAHTLHMTIDPARDDPLYVWDWYKSNGCHFGSNSTSVMAGWDPTLCVNGPGHLSFVLVDGDINTSPPAGPKFPLMFHAVPKANAYSWTNRESFTGSFMWWGTITYNRQNVPGATSDTGWSLKFFE